MNLPDLPQQHKKQEADFGVFLRHWLEKNPQFKTCAIETKHTRGKNSFNFNELKVEQIAYALKTQSKDGVLIRVRGLQGEQDYIFLRQEPSFVCIKYPNDFCILSIEDFIKEKQASKRKSLTYERAKELSILQ